MDELSFEKTYQDGGLVRLWVSASSGLCGARRGLYEDEAAVRAAAGEVLGYSRDFSRGRSVVLGRWEGGPAPALSLRILPADSRGHVTLEVDMEIDDDGDRHAHRARFFVKSELGPVGRLGASLLSLAGGPVGSHATLNDDPGGLPWYMAEGGSAGGRAAGRQGGHPARAHARLGREAGRPRYGPLRVGEGRGRGHRGLPRGEGRPHPRGLRLEDASRRRGGPRRRRVAGRGGRAERLCDGVLPQGDGVHRVALPREG